MSEKKSSTRCVSILMPSYNHASYIEVAIVSVFAERGECLDIELIVVDDCSSDNTDEILRELQKKFRFIYHQNEKNLGVSETLKKAFSFATGDFVRVLASDDFLLAGQLKRQIEFLDTTGSDIAYAKGEIYDAKGNLIVGQSLNDFAQALAKSPAKAFQLAAIDDTCGPLFQSAVLRTTIMTDVVDLWGKYKSDDWIVLLHLLRYRNVALFDDYVFGYRLHDGNSHKKAWRMFQVRLEVLCNFIVAIEPDLFRRAFCNLLVSHGAALFRGGERLLALSFFASSLCFGIPWKKVRRALKRIVHGKLKFF